MGLWLLQECMRAWGRKDIDPLLAEAARTPALRYVVDAAAPEFLAPGDMPGRITDACRATGQPEPRTPGRPRAASSTRWPSPTGARSTRRGAWPTARSTSCTSSAAGLATPCSAN